MTTFKLETTPRLTSLGLWKLQRDGSYRCGNVKVKRVPKRDRTNWRIFVFRKVRRGVGRWCLVTLKQRPWGYGHQGQAKIGAALVAAHQRGAFTKPENS